MSETLLIERAQTGVRLEKSMLKVLKGLAEYLEISLGDLLEGIILHAFEGRSAFEGKPQLLETIARLRGIYGMSYDASFAHKLVEAVGEVSDERR